MDTSPRLAFLYLSEGQAQGEIPVNTNANTLETLIGACILDRSLATPPATPANGDAYIVKATATDEWLGQEGNIAYYYDGWYFVVPAKGLLIFVDNESQFLLFNGTAWVRPNDIYKVLTAAGTMNIDPAQGEKQSILMTTNVVATMIAGQYDGQTMRLRLKQDGTGSWTFTATLGLSTTFASWTLTTTANAADVVTLEWNAGLAKWVIVGLVQGIS